MSLTTTSGRTASMHAIAASTSDASVHLRAGVLEHAPDQDARVEVVLDDEDADAVAGWAAARRAPAPRGAAARCRSCRGSRTVNVEPC